MTFASKGVNLQKIGKVKYKGNIHQKGSFLAKQVKVMGHSYFK